MTPACRVIAALGLALSALAAAGAARAEPPGDPARGYQVFAAKACARCHLPRGQEGVGPALDQLRRPQGAFALSGRLWNHAPAMFTVLKMTDLQWPQISGAEMGDLMAFLEADPTRDPASDVAKGQLVLLRKSCLKCHALRGEGARLAPDLSAQRSAYESAVTWATRMWSHAPAMAAKAIEIGVLYPRFAEDEMLNLVAFLRTSAR